ncbi:hypothetical protein H1R20_g12090, partial [Candolleomyces eurysporus]
MNRFAVTLASQLVVAIPATAPLIEAALGAEPGIVTGDAPLATQLDLLILSPFQAVVNQGVLRETLAKGPFLIVVDGLDECEDKRGVKEFINHMLDFFGKHPSIPLRIFIASRVEEHIRQRLAANKVQLGDLDSHSPVKDIEKFLQASFRAAAEQDRVIRAFVRACGEWPTKSDMDKLIEHIGGSFVLASKVFKFIVQPAAAEDALTPMERLPVTLDMNGLDGLYTQTLARSQHLPHFHSIISTIALFQKSLPIVGIADLLDIPTSEVVHVLLDLQAIIHVPGTDENGLVTLCHTSLRDFLTTESRSRSFFVQPSFHLRLTYHCFASIFESCTDGRDPYEQPDHYGQQYFDYHLRLLASPEACNFIDEIERFKASQSPFVDEPPSWHAFLCSMFFFSIVRNNSPIADRFSYILTECTKHLALAVEFGPDSRIRHWLQHWLHYGWMPLDSSLRKVQFTEATTVQHYLCRASTIIHAKVCLLNFILPLQHVS